MDLIKKTVGKPSAERQASSQERILFIITSNWKLNNNKNMKFLLALSLLFTCEAFVPSSRFGVQTLTALNEQRGNASEAIKAAMEASRTFGGTSSEARVAWDIVEEINASDNRWVSKYCTRLYSQQYCMGRHPIIVLISSHHLYAIPQQCIQGR